MVIANNSSETPAVFIAKLASDAECVEGAIADVTGFVFTYVANAVYSIWVMGRAYATESGEGNTSYGISLGFNVSSAITAIDSHFFHGLANTGTLTGSGSIADDTYPLEGSTGGLLTTKPFLLTGILVSEGNTGTCQMRLDEEVGEITNNVSVFIKAGAVMVVQRIA